MLLRSFVIALVLVAPVALWQWRRIRARRSEAPDEGPADRHTGATTGGPEPDPGSLEAVIARIAELAATTPVGEVVSIGVPVDATVDGRQVPPSVSDPIVVDALARGGFEVLGRTTVTEGTASASVFECRRR